MDQIIPQIWQGFQCFLLGTNFITRANGFDCSEDVTCGNPVFIPFFYTHSFIRSSILFLFIHLFTFTYLNSLFLCFDSYDGRDSISTFIPFIYIPFFALIDFISFLLFALIHFI